MATLTGNTIVSTYAGLLSVNGAISTGSVEVVEDGAGTNTALWLSTVGATLGVDDTGADFRVFSATAGEGLFYDASQDEFGLLLTTKLKFHDIGGGEEIFASANGHLEINAGTTLDITAPTVDVNASSELNIDGNVDLNGTLDVSGTSTLGGTLTVNAGAVFNEASADVNFRIEDNTNLNAFFVEGGAAAGLPRIGIGTAAPATVLHTLATGGDNIFTVEARNNAQIILHNNYATFSSTAYDSSIKFLSRPASGDGSAAGWLLGQDHGAAQKFKLSFASGDPTAPAFGTNDYLTVDVSGLVGIGTNAPTSKLIVRNDDDFLSATVHVLHVMDNHATADAGDVLARFDYSGDADVHTALAKFISFHDSGGEIGYIATSSDGVISSSILSDVRLKTDIKDTSIDGLNIVNALKIRDFKWGDKANANQIGKQVVGGLVADEVYEVYSKAVHGKPGQMRTEITPATEDVPEKTEEVINPMGVSSSEFISVLIKAVQELSASNDALKARIEVLEAE